MFRKAILILTFLNLLANIYAQELLDYKLISHRAFIKINPDSKIINITDTIKLNLFSKKTSYKIILNPIFDSLSITHKNQIIRYERDNEKIIIKGKFDNSAEIILNYSGFFRNKSEFSVLDTNKAILKEQEILPLGTKSYEFTRFTIQIPRDWSAIAVGTKIFETYNQDSKICIFENNNLIETIGWICAGKYKVVHDSLPNIKLSIFTIDDRFEFYNSLFHILKKSLEFYSNSFINYRFPALTIVEVDDWLAGNAVLAASFPSVILAKKKTFTTPDSFNFITSILPHEIAHQWWPLTNFLDDESITFLSEGLCEYSAYLFKETIGEKINLSNHPLLRSLLIKSEKGREIPINIKIDLRNMPTHYLKSAYVHHMLRFIIGDLNYKKLLNEYANKYSLKVSNTKNFFELAETISGTNLEWFNKQWIENTGVPRFKVYGVQTKFVDTAWFTTGRVRMIGYSKNFTTPVEISAIQNNEISKQVLWLGYDESVKYKNEAVFRFITKNKPEKIVLDPDGYILKWQKLPPKLSDLRDPSDGFMIIGTVCSAERYEQLLNLAKNDSAEMVRAGWILKILDDTTTTLSHLQSEHIFIYGNFYENTIAEKCFNHFPIKPQMNSVEINGNIYSDSLSLIQFIENPFFPQGTMCWTIPFTKESYPVLLPYDASYLILYKSNIILKGEWESENNDLIIKIK